MEHGIVFDIKKTSADDGPGLRTVVFLKGCPLRCIWCHSPESINSKPDLAVYESKCIECNRCIEVCPNGVHLLNKEGERLILREKCKACGVCVQYCYAGALDIKGKKIQSDDLFHEIEKDRVFYDISGGGVTFSGGEPMFQPSFLLDILRQLKTAGIHTAVDTCGYASPDIVQSILSFVDLFLFDLKCMDERKHRELTGVSNDTILRNLKIIAGSGIDVLVSFPIIPGYNSSFANLSQTMQFVKEVGIKKMRLLPYNKLAGSKYKWLGRSYPLEDIEPLGVDWMEKAEKMAKNYGIDLTIK